MRFSKRTLTKSLLSALLMLLLILADNNPARGISNWISTGSVCAALYAPGHPWCLNQYGGPRIVDILSTSSTLNPENGMNASVTVVFRFLIDGGTGNGSTWQRSFLPITNGTQTLYPQAIRIAPVPVPDNFEINYLPYQDEPEPEPEPDPDPDPSPSPSPTPTPTPTQNPDSGSSPPSIDFSSPSQALQSGTQDPTFNPEFSGLMNRPNFLSYAGGQLANKFPFDAIGTMPSGGTNDCPKVSLNFMGQTVEREICEVNAALETAKYPVWAAWMLKLMTSL